MTGFVLLRAAGHRLLLAAALLAVALTTCVLAALTAFSASVGDTALRETLRGGDAASAVLVVSADVPGQGTGQRPGPGAGQGRDAAEAAVRKAAREAYDGLPVTVRRLERSGPYALPASLRPASESVSAAVSAPGSPSAPGAEEKPDLTHFAALDRSRITLVAGAWPTPRGTAAGPGSGPDSATDSATDSTAGSGPLPVALPEEAARRLELAPGARFTLTDRLSDARRTVLVTGTYRATDPDDPYWRLDALGGRGVTEGGFTTYGPLLTDAAELAAGDLSRAATGWLAAADFRTVTTDRIDALRTASTEVPERLRADPALGGSASATTALPALLDRTERALLVSRSTLLIVALQLLLLAGCTLLMVARSLGTERAGETELLRARGASRARLAGLAATEALLLALPAALCAALLAAPLTALLARSTATTAGAGGAGGADGASEAVWPGGWPGWPVWLVSGAVALGCAALVVVPTLRRAAGDPETPGPDRASGASGSGRGSGVSRTGERNGTRGRGAALPGPVRAGADLALLLVAALAYWQLDQRTGGGEGAGTGVLGSDRAGRLGIDPFLVAAPALALLAGTVLTLRLLPPLAGLAERRAARGRGLPGALAAHRLARRSLRGAGPALLLVLAVATGLLAIGQSASWDRSQRDQADFATGASVRVLDARPAEPGQAGRYATLPGVRQAAPAHRTETSLSGGRTATVLALDTAHAEERMLARPDLLDGDPENLTAGLAPGKAADRTGAGPGNGPGTGPGNGAGSGAGNGITLPDGARALTLDVRMTTVRGPGAPPASPSAPTLLVVVEDRYGIPYRLSAGQLPADGRPHRATVALDLTASNARSAPAGPLRVTGLRLGGTAPGQDQEPERHRLTVERLATGDGDVVPVPDGLRWRGGVTVQESAAPGAPTALAPAASATAPLTVTYSTGHAQNGGTARFTVRLDVAGAAPPARTTGVPAVATDAFLRATGAARGDDVDVTLAGEQIRVTVVRTVRELPTTGTAIGTSTGTSAGGVAGAATGTSTRPAAGTPGESARTDGGALLVDLKAANAALAARTARSYAGDASLAPNEWWLSTAPGAAAQVAAALRDRSGGAAPAQVLVREETAAGLLADPLGDGPRAALLAVARTAAALAAVGFAVATAGALRERGAELAVLRALGAPRRGLARLVATEQGVLIGIGLAVGAALGVALARALVPLTVLTAGATRPRPPVLVELPPGQVALFLLAVAAVPLLLTALLAARRGTGLAAALRHQGDH